MQFHYIANAFHPSASSRTLPVIDPSDGQVFDELQRGTADDIDQASDRILLCVNKLRSANKRPNSPRPRGAEQLNPL